MPRGGLAAAFVALAALGGACARDAGDGALTGAGATLPYPLYMRWIRELGRERPGLRVNYQSIGSGGGIRQITQRTVDFGATDAPLSDEQLARAPGLVHVPTCIGAVVLAYRLEGVGSGLRLTADAAAGIFLGAIERWDDPAIARENPGVYLPHRRIAPVHRSDGSGTTRLFTEWLSAGSARWASGPGSGTSVEFPAGLGAKGNEGVAAHLATVPGAIGYLELAYAEQGGLSRAALQNAAGAFVLPTPESAARAGASVVESLPADLRTSLIGARDEGAYPIAGLSYVVFYRRQESAAKGRALVELLRWALHDGQAFAPALRYAPLPAALVEKADALLSSVTGPDDLPVRPRSREEDR